MTSYYFNYSFLSRYVLEKCYDLLKIIAIESLNSFNFFKLVRIAWKSQHNINSILLFVFTESQTVAILKVMKVIVYLDYFDEWMVFCLLFLWMEIKNTHNKYTHPHHVKGYG